MVQNHMSTLARLQGSSQPRSIPSPLPHPTPYPLPRSSPPLQAAGTSRITVSLLLPLHRFSRSHLCSASSVRDERQETDRRWQKIMRRQQPRRSHTATPFSVLHNTPPLRRMVTKPSLPPLSGPLISCDLGPARSRPRHQTRLLIEMNDLDWSVKHLPSTPLYKRSI